MFEESFSYMLDQFGVPVKLNDETNTRNVLLTSRGISKMETNFDDRVVHTNFKIKRGDVMEYNGTLFLVFSDVQAKRGQEYQSLIRPMTTVFPYTYMTEGVWEYDRYGNKVYTEEPKEITESLPCVAYQDETPKLDGGQIVVPENRIKVIMSDNTVTAKIEADNTTPYKLKNSYYKVTNINLFQEGIRIFTMEWTTSPA